MKLKFSEKDKIIAGLEVPVVFKYTTHKSGEPMEFYSSNNKLSFIDHCVAYRLTLAEIGELLGTSKQRIYQLYRYGKSKITATQRKEIRKRDKNKCRICNNKKNLHTHHIKNSRNHKENNLITLCSSCHRKIESIYKKPKKKLSTVKHLTKVKTGL